MECSSDAPSTTEAAFYQRVAVRRSLTDQCDSGVFDSVLVSVRMAANLNTNFITDENLSGRLG